MFKYQDTEIVSDMARPTGAYILAHSEDCQGAYRKGYTVRHYEGQEVADPWHDQADSSIDFGNITEALAELNAFPEEDHNKLREWLTEELGQ